ncbi:MAG: EutN/CcmL family microcompartment protein [Myxococcota bacterium]|nr:EutN/CcmL family microcompartment protein [Myxococcota bacterium]
MELARVVGTVVATRKHEALEGVRLLLIQPQDHEGAPQGDVVVAADAVQAGEGELVRWINGREGTLALPDSFTPVDATIVGIVTDVNARSLK